jgi:hypothetical protein
MGETITIARVAQSVRFPYDTVSHTLFECKFTTTARMTMRSYAIGCHKSDAHLFRRGTRARVHCCRVGPYAQKLRNRIPLRLTTCEISGVELTRTYRSRRRSRFAQRSTQRRSKRTLTFFYFFIFFIRSPPCTYTRRRYYDRVYNDCDKFSVVYESFFYY